jgi:tetratricopeptide (TPR) repeat protein
MAECYDLFGQIHTVRCEWTEALESFDKALAIRERVGHAAGIVESLLGRGMVHELHGGWPRAKVDYGQALQTAEAMDPSPQLVLAHCHLGLLDLHLGNEDVAAREIGAGRALAETMPERLEYSFALLASAELALASAAAGDAVGYAEQALQVARTAESSIRARATLTMALLVSGQVATAGDQRDELLQAAEQFGSPMLLGLAHLTIGRLAEAIGCLDDAMRYLKRAATDFAGAETPYWHGIALIEECRARRQAGKTSCTRSTAAAALEMLERLGARRAAEQARSLLDGSPG